MIRKLQQTQRARERAEALRRPERGFGLFDYVAVLAIVAAIFTAWSQVLT